MEKGFSEEEIMAINRIAVAAISRGVMVMHVQSELCNIAIGLGIADAEKLREHYQKQIAGK
jgi:hypothetical protein